MYVVVYKNNPRYKGTAVFLLSAVASAETGVRPQTTDDLQEAKTFDYKLDADAVARRWPVFDKAHQKAKVVEVRRELRLV